MLGQTNQDVKIQWQVIVRHVVLLKMSHTFSYIVQDPSKLIRAHLNCGPPSSNGGIKKQDNTSTPLIELYYWLALARMFNDLWQMSMSKYPLIFRKCFDMTFAQIINRSVANVHRQSI